MLKIQNLIKKVIIFPRCNLYFPHLTEFWAQYTPKTILGFFEKMYSDTSYKQGLTILFEIQHF